MRRIFLGLVSLVFCMMVSVMILGCFATKNRGADILCEVKGERISDCRVWLDCGPIGGVIVTETVDSCLFMNAVKIGDIVPRP